VEGGRQGFQKIAGAFFARVELLRPALFGVLGCRADFATELFTSMPCGKGPVLTRQERFLASGAGFVTDPIVIQQRAGDGPSFLLPIGASAHMDEKQTVDRQHGPFRGMRLDGTGAIDLLRAWSSPQRETWSGRARRLIFPLFMRQGPFTFSGGRTWLGFIL